MMLPLLAALSILALMAAFFFWRLARVHRASTGLPFNAKVVYADTGAWRKIEQPLISRQYALAGKPDYVIEQNGSIVPVEVKPTRTATAPRDGDVMQLTDAMETGRARQTNGGQ